MPRPTKRLLQLMTLAVHPHRGGGEGHGRWPGLRHLRMALWDDREFRAVRGAGISPAAAGDRGRCPLDPCDFLKKIE